MSGLQPQSTNEFQVHDHTKFFHIKSTQFIGTNWEEKWVQKNNKIKLNK